MTTALTAEIQPASSTDDEIEEEEDDDASLSIPLPKPPVKKDNNYKDFKGVKEETVKDKNIVKDKNVKLGVGVIAIDNDQEEGYSSDLDLSNPLYTCAFICKWDFKSQRPQQVSAVRGEVLDLLNKDYDEYGWWTVQSSKGKVGLVPKKWLVPAYEKIIVD